MNRFITATLLVSAATIATASHAEDQSSNSTIPTVVIEAKKVSDYTVKNASSATKTDTPLLETPVSVTVLPRALLDDLQVITVKDALVNDSSVQSSGNEYYDTYLIRGFDVNAIFRNGLETERLGQTIDTAFADRIEIIKGPESFLYGRIEPGGLVNVVTKEPQAKPALDVQQQIGSWGQYRTVADATGPLTSDGTLLYRSIGVYDRADSWVDFDQKRNWAMYHSLKWTPSTSFTANASLEFYDKAFTSPGEQQVPVINGVPGQENGQILNLPRNFTAGDPVLNKVPTSQVRTEAAIDWSWQFADSWKLSQKFLYFHSAETQNIIFLGSAVNAAQPYGDWVRNSWLSQDWTRDSYANNLDLEGRFSALGLTHNLLAGFDWYEHTDVQNVHCCGPDAAIPNLNLGNPVYGSLSSSAVRSLPVNFYWRNYYNDFGLYLQDQISLDERWFLILSGRYDWAFTAYPVNSNVGQYPLYGAQDQAFTPRVGLLHKLSDAVSLYATYAEGFGAANFAQGQYLFPQTSQQYEAGAKSELLDGKLTASFSLFDIYKQNIPYTPFPGITTLTGEAESRGIELSMNGNLTANLKIVASYTYDLALVTKDSNGNVGHRFFGVPRHSASLWSVWDAAPGEQVGWQAGGGIYYRGARDGNPSNAADWVEPGYTRVDVMASYRTVLEGTPVEAQLNIENLFDRTYIDRAAASSAGGDFATYGAPRTFIGSLKAHF